MLAILLFVLQLVCQLITLPFSWLIFQIWDRAVRRPQTLRGASAEPDTSFVILVPAHNEETSLARTIVSLQKLDYPKHLLEILVIADNCQDATAEVAVKAGAQVLERFDQSKKSKGFALEYALETLRKRAKHPDAVVVIDADSVVDPGLLLAFDRRLQGGHDWLQAYYTVANPDDSWRTQMMSYAFAHFNGVWLLGQDALGLGSALRGNGMAFSWKGLERCPWQAYGLAEDLEFSWRLRQSQEKVVFVPEVRVYGEMIDRNPAAIAAQRLRWEHGRKQLRQTFSREIWRGTGSKSRRFILLTDLYMPALAGYTARLLLTLASAIGFHAVELASPWDGLSSLFLGLALVQCLNFAIYIFMPFILMKLPKSYLKLFVLVPFYAVWKLGLMLKKAPAAWVRTERNK